MRILALETVAAAGSIASWMTSVSSRSPNLTPRAARTDAGSGIAELLKRGGWRPTDVELVAVAIGPGSFTGLRIGVTTAKAFAYAVGCKVVGVNSLAAVVSGASRRATKNLGGHRREARRAVRGGLYAAFGWNPDRS